MLRAEQTLRRNHRCSCPRPPSWHPQARIRTRGTVPFVLPFVSPLLFSWCASYLLAAGLGGGQKGSLQCAATARTADRKSGKMHAAMI